MIGGNPDDFRAAARRVRDSGEEVTRSTEAVLARGPRWHSTAGDAYQDRLEDVLRTAARAAEVADLYAASLDGLADGLEERQRAIAALLEQAGATWDDARRMVAEGASDLMTGARSLADGAADRAGDLVDGIQKVLP
jgi:ABC-type transporter Mla subunit MlaD